MLEKSVIEGNKKRFIDLFKKYVVPNYDNADKLLEWICNTDFFISPASTRYHLCVEGGLCQHTLNVYDRLVKVLKDEYGNDYNKALGINDASIVLVALCHDLCKCECYEKDYRNKKQYSDKGSKRDEKGNFDWVVEEYWVKNEKFVFGHGAKSVFIVQNFITTPLSLDEASAIRYHMGGHEWGNPNLTESDPLTVFNDYPLAFYLHIADMEATYIDERETSEC